MTGRILIAAFLAAVFLSAALPADQTIAGTTVRGDANCDGVMDALDVALILQLDAGLIDTLDCKAAADVDYNSTYNVIDASFILRRIAGVNGSLPALLHIEVTPAGPIEVGEEFTADVRIEGVEHLAGFEVTLLFSEKPINFERVESPGVFLEEGSRPDLRCGQPAAGPGEAVLTCTTGGPAVCLGGPAGASGEGSLGRFVFRAEQPGVARITLAPGMLHLDDARPCVARAELQRIHHKRLGADAEIIVTQ